MKKLISIATIFTVAAMVIGPSAVSGDALSDLQASYNALLTQLTALQAQIAALGGTATGTAPAACAGVTFSANLTVGSTGTAVKCLQAILNQSADTQVAASGAGSPGNETTYFGSLTQAAVSKYQAKNSISPTAGYVGPLTRAKLNTVVAGGTGTGTGTGTGITTTGSAGTYTVLIDEPANTTYTAGSTERDVYGFSVKALGSDINISRTDLQVAVTNVAGTITYSPSSFVSGIKIYCGGNLVKTVDSPAFNLDSASVYFAQLSGFSCVVPKDTTKVLKFAFVTTGSIDVNRLLTARVYGNGVLGTDGMGVNTFTALTTVRTYTFQAPGNATLTAALATDNPVTNYWYSDALSGATNLPMIKFTLTATGGDATLTRFELLTASGTASTILPSVMRLYDGDTQVAGGSSTTGLTSDFVTFENIALAIPSSTTKTLTIKGDYAATTNTQFTQVSIPLTSLHCVFRQSNGTTANVTVGAANLAGGNQYMVSSGAKLSLVSTPTPVSQPMTIAGGTSVYTGTINFKVTAFGTTYGRTLFASPGTTTSDTGDAVYIEAYRTDTGALIAASGTHLTITRGLTTSPSSTDTSAGSDSTVSATYTLSTTIAGTAGYNVVFRVIGFSGASVGGAYEIMGQYPTAATTNNTLLDSYVTPAVYLVP